LTETSARAEFQVHEAAWPAAAAELRAVRQAVFVEEQGVPAALEWDGRDAGCLHLLARDGAGRAVGTVRMSRDGHIGRMAVLAGHRRRGVGGALLTDLVERARRAGLAAVHLNAQTSAEDFYRRHGFRPAGEVFLEAGIPHRAMTLLLRPSPLSIMEVETHQGRRMP